MNSHLQVIAARKSLNLGNDLSIDISFENPMFNDAQTFSYPVRIPLEGNRHLVKNIEEKRSTLRPVSLEDTFARINTDGFPFFAGNIKTSNDEEVTDTISFNIDGNQNFKNLIQDLECKDIPVKDDICIGEKLGEVTVKVKGEVYVEVNGRYGRFYIGQKEDGTIEKQTATVNFTPQALGFSVPYKCGRYIQHIPEIDASKSIITDATDEAYTHNKPVIDARYGKSYINVSAPYGETDPAGRFATYCNGRVAYKHYKLGNDGKTDSSNTDANPYMVLDADRPQSGICFYVLYFLDCLFDYLGLEWDNSELLKIEDFKRLCFYTTKCSYDEVNIKSYENRKDFDKINEWLDSRGCGAKLEIINTDELELSSFTVPKGTYFSDGYTGLWIKKGQLLQNVTFRKGETVENVKYHLIESYYPHNFEENKDYSNEYWRNADIRSWLRNMEIESVDYSLSEMYANSGNFPDTTVTEIIESLENQFGIRFIYEPEKYKVTARFIRDMYRKEKAPKPFLGTIKEMNKVSEKITGVRCMYSDESDGKDQTKNIREQVKDYDLNYDYIDYPDPTKIKQKGMAAACTTDMSKTFSQICVNASNTDNTCYIDKNTGNAYRVKIDSEYTSLDTMNARWFEAGTFKGAEFGDCSTKNKDYIREISSSFKPLSLSDVNYAAVKSACAAGISLSSMNIDQMPMLVPLCDEDMEHEYVVQYLEYPVDLITANVCVRTTLHLRENYDVSSSDDGNSPLQTYDWGNAIMIMRGGGTDSAVQTYEGNYDGFDNSKWRTTVGKYAMTNDSIDHLGNEYDYNSSQTGIGTGERFSLKPRAYKVPDWLDKPLKKADGTTVTYTLDDLCRADYHDSEGWHFIRTRGWADRFLYEHANFLINRRKFIIRAQCEAAFVADIPNHWQDKWIINGEVGYINKVTTSISVQNGIGETEIEFFAI